MAFAPKQTISINKMDAARRQLRTAIELWFTGGDPVSIHTLAFASHEIVHRLYRAKGLRDLMFDSVLIKDEYRSEFSKMIKEDATFFKHADKDPDKVKDFNPLANDLFILMSVVGVGRMGEQLNDAELAFNFWIYLHYPHWFPEDVAQDRIPVDRLEKMRSLDKVTFFKEYVAALEDKRRRGIGPDGKPI